MQLLFVLMVVLNVIGNVWLPDITEMSEPWMSWIYTALDVSMKLVLGLVIAAHAESRQFPALTCSVWDGEYKISTAEAGL